MPRLVFHVTQAFEGRKAKSIVRGEMGVSSHQFSRLKFTGGLTVDGEIAYANTVLHAGQTLCLAFEDEPAYLPQPFPMALSIPYEDEHLLLIDKPAPLPTQSSSRQEGPALENAVFSYMGCPRDFVFRPVNRLDKGTSGLMAAAKNPHCHQLMQRLLHTDDFIREYLALCDGNLPPAMAREGTIDLPIGKCPGATVKRQITPVSQGGKPAITHYRGVPIKSGCM